MWTLLNIFMLNFKKADKFAWQEGLHSMPSLSGNSSKASAMCVMQICPVHQLRFMNFSMKEHQERLGIIPLAYALPEQWTLP